MITYSCCLIHVVTYQQFLTSCYNAFTVTQITLLLHY